MALHIVIMAAGQGTRMLSTRPKVLHKIGGTPMLERVINTALMLQPEKIHVVIGHGGEQIKQALATFPVNWVWQKEQLGTGHAVLQALSFISEEDNVLILSGDVPLIQANTLQDLVNQHQLTPQTPFTLLIANLPDPTGFGRVIRNEAGHIVAIVEDKDASPSERLISEIYTGMCCVMARDLKRWLPELHFENEQYEYYLTEIVSFAVNEGNPLMTIEVKNKQEILGVNTRIQLHQLERMFQLTQASELMLAGVTLADAARIDIRGILKCEPDVFIDVNNVFKGESSIQGGSEIGPHCVLTNVTIGKNCVIHPHSVLEGCTIGDSCHIGPFARIRPGTQLAAHCKIGNFVETKNAVIDEDSKANHLSYLGDVTIGKGVNIGAGTITCNYDGANKHQTTIEDGVFVGSDTQFVAPITVGKNATIGAGSTIRKNVPANELTLTQSNQITIPGWKKPKKNQS